MKEKTQANMKAAGGIVAKHPFLAAAGISVIGLAAYSAAKGISPKKAMTDMKNATKEELKKIAAEATKLAKKAGKMTGGIINKIMNMLKIPLIIMAVLAIVFLALKFA